MRRFTREVDNFLFDAEAADFAERIAKAEPTESNRREARVASDLADETMRIARRTEFRRGIYRN